MGNTFTCGHSLNASNPVDYFGRGQARVRRIAAYFGRVCPACAAGAARSRFRSLTSSISTEQEWVTRALKSYHPHHRDMGDLWPCDSYDHDDCVGQIELRTGGWKRCSCDCHKLNLSAANTKELRQMPESTFIEEWTRPAVLQRFPFNDLLAEAKRRGYNAEGRQVTPEPEQTEGLSCNY